MPRQARQASGTGIYHVMMRGINHQNTVTGFPSRGFLDFEAHKKLVRMQPGDVPTTYADATALERDFGFTPKITLREGLRKFAEWYKEYYM